MKIEQAYNYLRNILSKYIYLVYGFLAGILLGACFFDFFAYIACAYVVLVSLFLDDTHVLCLLFFIYPFVIPFSFSSGWQTKMFDMLKYLLILNVFLRHILISIKQKAKPNFKILIAFAVFIIYLVVIPNHRLSYLSVTRILTAMALIYMLIQKRLNFKISKILEFFVLGVIISCFFGMLKPFSERIQEFSINDYIYDNILRFTGLFHGTNTLAKIIVIAIICLCILSYFNKINQVKTVIYNSLLFLFGLLTLSRSFIITVFIAYFIYVVLYLIRYKKSSLRLLIYMLLGMLLVCAICYGKISVVIERVFAEEIEFDNFTPEVQQQIMNGEMFYDPGRHDLIVLYLRDITSSLTNLLLGKGIITPYIGQTSCHNHYLNLLWMYGIVGVLIYVTVILMCVNFKKINLKNIKQNLYLLIFIVPLLVVMFVEIHSMYEFLWVVLLLLINLKDEDKEKEKKVNKKSQVSKMKFMEEYEKWFKSDVIDEKTKAELRKLDKEKDRKEIEDRFMTNLEFGTGGMRGIVGAGTNRLNKYIIGKATQGLANFLKQNYSEKDLERGVVIAYDTRNTSVEFSEVTSDVLTANGINTFLFSVPVPTPELSFAVKYKNAIAGIVITASHNPKEYNGYKVYDEFGCQIVPSQAEELIKFVNDCDSFSKINFAGDKSKEQKFDCTDEFCEAVLKQSVFKYGQAKKDLKIVYTPLHGTGNIPVRKTLSLDGFESVFVQKEQEIADGNFPTVKVPNPEDKNALSLAIELAKEVDADIVLGNDPDCDRVGVAVKTNDGFCLLTGNQIGALLVDYICRKNDFKKLKNPAVIKTVVTSELGAEIAKKYGLNVFSTLTGFKFIGEKITQFEKAQLENNEEQNYSFVMGYEESYGYLVGTHARDKDAVVSSMLICEMASEYKSHKKTLLDKMNEIYDEFGVYKDFLDSFALSGIDGISRMKQIMKTLREEENLFENIKEKIDYKKDVMAEKGFGLLPKSDVVKFVFVDGSWIAVRPSGTEPKIKFYYSIKGSSIEEAENNLEKFRKQIREKFSL